MRIWIITLGLVFLLSPVAYAEDGGFIFSNGTYQNESAPSASSERISRLVSMLNLSQEQKDKAKKISTESKMKTEQLFANILLLQQQIREIENQSMDDFAEILTDEQKIKLYEIKMLRQEEYNAHDREINDIMQPFNE